MITSDSKYLKEMKEWFRHRVNIGEDAQLPADADMFSAKMYIANLEAENAELKARLERAVELPCIEPMTTWDRNEETGIVEEHFGEYYQLLYRDEEGEFICFPKLKKEEAEEQLKEMKEKNDD